MLLAFSFSEQETKRALEDLNPDKRAGPEGLFSKAFKILSLHITAGHQERNHNSENIPPKEFSLAHTRYADGKVNEHSALQFLLQIVAPYSPKSMNSRYCCRLYCRPLFVLLKRGLRHQSASPKYPLIVISFFEVTVQCPDVEVALLYKQNLCLCLLVL